MKNGGLKRKPEFERMMMFVNTGTLKLRRLVTRSGFFGSAKPGQVGIDDKLEITTRLLSATSEPDVNVYEHTVPTCISRGYPHACVYEFHASIPTKLEIPTMYISLV